MLGLSVTYYLGSVRVFVFYLLQSFVAASLLEAVNYVEHYGLLRKEISKDFYEIVSPKHSWNAPYRYNRHSFICQLNTNLIVAESLTTSYSNSNATQTITPTRLAVTKSSVRSILAHNCLLDTVV